ncbi:hypothetical protein WDU94_005612, partial [Cyamophila willieti]
EAEERRQLAEADERRRQVEADERRQLAEADERRQEAEDKRRELEHHRIVEKRQIDLEIVSKELENDRRNFVNHGHLPKISLIRFGGDSLSFSEFWDNFQSLIDGRTDLDDGQKFHYLKGQLFGKASDRIAGIRVCGENYRLAVDLLKEEFGSKDLILTTLYQEIAHLKPLSTKTSDLYQFYANLEIKFKMLENQGANLSYDTTLKHMVFPKLSSDTQDELVKIHGSSITIDHIRLQLSNELTRARVLRSLNPYESKTSSYASQPSLPRYPNRRNDRMYTTEMLLRPESESIPIPVIACVFCEGKHYSDSCKKYASLDERKQSMNGRCFICLSQTHFFRNCPKQNKYCYYCKAVGKHHRSLCPRQFGSFATNQHKYHDAKNVRSREIGGGDRIPIPGTSGFQGNRFTGGQTSGVLGEKVSTQCQSGGVDSETNCYSNDGNVKKKVFLQSASVYVFNKVTGEGRSVRAVLDSGSTSSYISESLVKTLGLTTDPGRNINVYTFGEHAPKTMRIYGTKVSLLDKANKVWDLHLGVTPTIVGENKSEYCDMKIVKDLTSMYTLADECFTSDIEQKYDVLIGNDYYLQFVLGDKVQLLDNLYLLNTVFGYVFSGQFSIGADCKSTGASSMSTLCIGVPVESPSNWPSCELSCVVTEKESFVPSGQSYFTGSNILADQTSRRKSIGCKRRKINSMFQWGLSCFRIIRIVLPILFIMLWSLTSLKSKFEHEPLEFVVTNVGVQKSIPFCFAFVSGLITSHSLCFQDSVPPDILRLCVPGSNVLNVLGRAWHNQYFRFLRERNNPLIRQGKMTSFVSKICDVVLIKQPNLARLSWPYDVIENTYHARDNRVRIVDVRLSNGQTVARPISLLFPFEFADQ